MNNYYDEDDCTTYVNDEGFNSWGVDPDYVIGDGMIDGIFMGDAYYQSLED